MSIRMSSHSALLRAFLSVFVALVLASSAAAPAAAQESSAKKILQLIGSANDKYEDEDYGGALEDYQRAFELYPDPSLLYRMGLSSEKMELQIEAIHYYEKFIDAVPDDKTAKKVKTRLAELRTTAPARMIIETTPPGAAIYVGSLETKSLGETPMQVDVAAGEVTLYVVLDGYETELRNLNLEHAEIKDIAFEMSEEKLVVVDPGEGATSTSEGVGLGTWGWVLTGTGVALVGTGALFSVLSQGKTDDVNAYDKQAPGASPGELQDFKDTANAFYSTSVALYVAGGVVAVTGITFLIIDGMESESQASLNLDVSPTQGGAWVGLSGSF